MAIQFPNSAYTGQTFLADNGVEYYYDGVKWEGSASVINQVNDHLHAGNVDLYLYSNGIVQLPDQGDIVDANGQSVLAGITAGTGNYMFDGDVVNMPTLAKLNSGGVGQTGAAEIGTDVTFYSGQQPGADVRHSEIYMGSGAGEFRSIYDNSAGIQNSLTYSGVEDVFVPAFSGVVSQTPDVYSQYAIALDESNNIIIGATQQDGALTSSDWATGLGTLNAGYQVNGIFANTTQTQINGGTATTKLNLSDAGLSVTTDDNKTWVFGTDGNLVLPAGGTILFADNSNALTGGSSSSSLPVNHSGWPTVLTSSSDGTSVSWGQNDRLQVNGKFLLLTGTDCNMTYQNGGTLFTELVVNNNTFNPQAVGNVMITSNKFAGPHSWSFGTNGNLILPANGHILNSDLSLYGGSGSGTADIGFVTGALYRYNGVIVENADLSHQATGALLIPGNHSGLDVQLNNSAGNVTISTGTNSLGNTWIFGSDGNLTLPAGGEIHSATGIGNVYINSNDGTNSYNWTFGSNGILNVPAEIMDLTGNNHVNLNDNGGIAIGTFGPNPVSIYTDDGNNYYSWWLDEKGFLSLPDCGSGPPSGTPDNGPAFAQSGGVLYWHDGASWRTVNLT